MAEMEQAESSPSFGSDIFCPVCSYSLYAAPANKCPECGHSLANLRNQECRIPWTRRRTAGRLRTYWQTVWMVTFRPLQFWEEYTHVVRLRDARLFQLVTVLYAYLAVGGATLVLYATTPFEPEVGNPFRQMMTTGFVTTGPTVFDRAYAEVWPVVILHICFILFLFAAMGVPAYFFHPHSVAPQQQNNAVAMSVYACAPLAFYPVLVLVICILAPVVSLDRWGLAYLLVPSRWPGIGLFACAGVCAVVWWWGLLRLVQRTMPLRKQSAPPTLHPAPARPRRRLPPEVLTDAEVCALMRACGRYAPTGLRNRALIALLYRAGLRINEALSLYPTSITPFDFDSPCAVG